ncbi:putative membrane protein [Methanocella conradii HZ254]|uniref:Membrane protein n=1 Tax=Methanocella conradii (strain DSM 24694 / JCM 17849 / CGMCC 1.5162 / HZ254) TaxID=1041930 RepID=H8I7P0_METCZ|nr:trimeric intracellular cation channel family protein [Methanocella conradii]AFC99875.1 putative membrane protein [Methanocella conradii HZ254]MDI6896167.1 trimeric intracellular cation channel family protein [Methanocella conradii]
MLEGLLFESFVAMGTIAFAMSGAFKAIRHEFDVLGLLVLGFSTALGGGLIRDALLHRTPAAFIDDGPAVYALIGCAITMLSHRLSRKHVFGLTDPNSRAFLFLDAIGLAAFTVMGASAGAASGLNAFGIVMLAALTGVGGGMIRDVLAGETPLVLKEDFYATATIIGAIIFFAMYRLSFAMATVTAASFMVTLLLRLLAIQYRWQLPKPKL